MLIIALAAVVSETPLKQVARPPSPGFITGFEQSANGSSIREEVPAGETVEHWTRMITTQRFEQLATRVGPAQFLGVLATSTVSACTGAHASPVQESGGIVEVRLDCPLNPQTGLPETFIARALTSGADLYVVQVAWRRAPTPGDIRWGTTYLKGVRLKSSN